MSVDEASEGGEVQERRVIDRVSSQNGLAVRASAARAKSILYDLSCLMLSLGKRLADQLFKRLRGRSKMRVLLR